MILLTRTRDATVLGKFTGKNLQKKLAKLLKYYYEESEAISFKAKTRQVWSPAKAQLKVESYGKCAYCEADTSVVAHGDVEHFRPKSEYWWLAYCYDNYTYSCQICNQSYKSDQFPRVGPKLKRPKFPAQLPTNPQKLAKAVIGLCPDPALITDGILRTLLQSEDADLPHPYLDDPERLYGWREIPEAKEVHITALSSSARARRALKAAEEVLGLNRTELLRVRWLAFEEMETMALALQEGALKPAMERRVANQLRASAESGRPFAAMKRFFLRQWGILK